MPDVSTSGPRPPASCRRRSTRRRRRPFDRERPAVELDVELPGPVAIGPRWARTAVPGPSPPQPLTRREAVEARSRARRRPSARRTIAATRAADPLDRRLPQDQPEAPRRSGGAATGTASPTPRSAGRGGPPRTASGITPTRMKNAPSRGAGDRRAWPPTIATGCDPGDGQVPATASPECVGDAPSTGRYPGVGRAARGRC